MIVEMNTLDRGEITRLISNEISSKLSANDMVKLQRCVDETTVVWAGLYKGQLKAFWGLVPPTMISDTAYLWLYVTEAIDDCEFVFVRNSQRAVEQALQRYPNIVGHCLCNDKRAQRWLKWLGAKFDKSDGTKVPFTIKARENEPHFAH